MSVVRERYREDPTVVENIPKWHLTSSIFCAPTMCLLLQRARHLIEKRSKQPPYMPREAQECPVGRMLTTPCFSITPWIVLNAAIISYCQGSR